VDKVRVVLGGQCSNETMAAAPIAEENKVLLFTPFSSAPAVTAAGDYVFQMWPSDVLAAEQIAIMMKDRGAKKVAIISELGEYPQGLRVALKPFFAKQGIEVVYDESYASDVTDFRSYASKLNAIGADSVFLNPQASASGARVAKALRDIGNTSQFYAYYITDSAFVKSGSSVNGTYLLDFDTVSDKSKGAKLSEEYKNVYGKDPAYMTGVVLGYESASIVFNAMRHIGSDDAAKIKDYLYTMKPFSGVTGET
jgi:branched-chain amino acid transport system substrate-binding protein